MIVFDSCSSNTGFSQGKVLAKTMSGDGGWRQGSGYRTATPSSSQGNPWHGSNETEKGEKTQKLTASEQKQGGQASAHQQQQEQHVGPYVLVTPNETRRKKLQQIAKKELNDLEQWKKEHKPGPITLVPQRLGGNESEAQVRQNQQMILMQSKYQKKHKREEYVKAKKAAEEAEILKKKAIQREKAERLEVKKRQEEMQRREILLEDQKYKTNELLNRLDVGLPKSDSCQIANPGPESTAWGILRTRGLLTDLFLINGNQIYILRLDENLKYALYPSTGGVKLLGIKEEQDTRHKTDFQKANRSGKQHSTVMAQEQSSFEVHDLIFFGMKNQKMFLKNAVIEHFLLIDSGV
ncbi:hypothetical protein HGM15179_004657 [Zosterops borbonicus]|uniref:Uncharacterized protein n=1 Tax=Zosterops borbonicus TaxID=364589 RepID=A0A8K1GS51_9PASS|nr:hypothetical protein HGM15179_004657 [Zosterops borbonicus]